MHYSTVSTRQHPTHPLTGTDTTAQLAHDSSEFEKEGDALESSGEHALALACYTKAASE